MDGGRKGGEVGGIGLRYKEERRKVGGRSLPFSQGRSKIANNRARPLGGAKK